MTAELRSLDFHGEVVFLVSHPESGAPYVPIRPLCEQLGVSRQGQTSKLMADPELWRGQDILLPSPGGPQTMTCLPLENLNGWLFSIQAARVKPEFRERLRTYQKECFQVLDAYWRTGAAIRPEVRAAAPEATRALFEEIEGMTGLNPEAAQPGNSQAERSLPPLVPRVKDWQREVESARYELLEYIDQLQSEHGWELERIIDALPLLAEQDGELLDVMRRANARAGEGRMVSRRTIYRWRDERKRAYREAAVPASLTVPGSVLPSGVTMRDVIEVYGAAAPVALHRLNPRAFPDPGTLQMAGGAR